MRELVAFWQRVIFNIILATGYEHEGGLIKAEQSIKNPDCGADKDGAKNY